MGGILPTLLSNLTHIYISEMAYTLYHAKGCGSVAVQVALRVLDVRHHLVELDYDETAARTNKDTPEFQAFTTANPLGLLHRTRLD